jgi:TRAP-type C4-dicarboxylate transport system permease small subunit
MSQPVLEVLNYVYSILSQVIYFVATILLAWGGLKLKQYLQEKKLYDSFKWVVYLIFLAAAYFFIYDVVFSVISFISTISQSGASSTAVQ